ncbi:MAG: gfo/Idh/MocA family oxidoreductase [Planctomycetota bacterium]|nr:MAG: gfo/Idh/MocA family oxidoreductase [Planctomycetota bacterium]
MAPASASTAPLRVGIIGAGQISQGAANDFNGDARAQVVALADPSPERLNALADKAGIPKRFSTGEELIAADGIDAVYVAVPNKFHAPLAKAALEADKHVILDKPFALNLPEAQAVAAAAAASGRVLMLGMNQRFKPSSQIARARVRAGVFGEVYHAKACWRRRAGIPRIGSWFTQKAVSGGGGLLDIGVHMLDLALYVLDNFKPLSVSGAAYTKLGNQGLGSGGWGMSEIDPNAVFDVDDFATALIKLEGGVSLCLDASWALHQPEPNYDDLHLFGTAAGGSANSGEIYRFGAAGGYEILQGLPAGDLATVSGNRFSNFIGACLGEHEPEVTVAQALAVQAIIDAIYASSNNGRDVEISF